MEIVTSVDAVKEWSRLRRAGGSTIGLVPTMGYLHEGHVSLMRRARSENDHVAATIFVNPTQFGPNEDLERYPRDPEGDAQKCRDAGVDLLFMPDVHEVYGLNFQTYVNVEEVSKLLCGASRPGHFRGVATVVLKLFNMFNPTTAYFGQKDYQQLQVIKTMAKDLNLEVHICGCETIREQDGLAMSSRNAYLTAHERNQAMCLYQALQKAQALFEGGEHTPETYISVMRERIEREPDTVVEYVKVVHPETLQDLDAVSGPALAALAVRIGKARLIDNMLLMRASA
jgi:pantoate--beta-alanine ligase